MKELRFGIPFQGQRHLWCLYRVVSIANKVYNIIHDTNELMSLIFRGVRIVRKSNPNLNLGRVLIRIQELNHWRAEFGFVGYGRFSIQIRKSKHWRALFWFNLWEMNNVWFGIQDLNLRWAVYAFRFVECNR